MTVSTSIFILCFLFTAIAAATLGFDNLTMRGENTALRRRNECYRRRLERQISINFELLGERKNENEQDI